MFNIQTDDINLDNLTDTSTIEVGSDETSFMNLNNELLKPAIDDYYDALKETLIGREYSKFKIDCKGKLKLHSYPAIDLMNSHTRKPLALYTIAVPSFEYDRTELHGLDKAMQTVRGELIYDIVKLSELDKHIAYEKTKLEQAGDEISRRCVAERLTCRRLE